MITIAVANQKGGVGKSTTALALGECLRRKGFNVLMVDLDAQGNLTYTMRGDMNKYNVMGVLQRPETIGQEVQHTAQGDLLASSTALAGADTVLTATGKEYRLREALEYIGRTTGVHDFCIIDTPPALGILTVNALTACNSVIIPALADMYSLQGLGQLNSTIQAVQRYCNPQIKIAGILLTHFNRRSTLKREIAEALEATAAQLNTRVFDSRIRVCQAISEAQARRVGLFEHAPRSNAATDYTNFTDEVLKGLTL